jgi:hypothetical protein
MIVEPRMAQAMEVQRRMGMMAREFFLMRAMWKGDATGERRN